MQITVPQSLCHYYHDRVIRSVVDALLTQKKEIMPIDIEWDDLKSYYDALLSAKKAQVDKAHFLLEAWDIIWKPLLEKHKIFEAYSITDMIEEDKDMTPSPEVIWNEGFHRQHALGVFSIYTHIEIIIDDGFYIGLSIESEDEADSLELSLSKQWGEMNDYGWYFTEGDLISIPQASESIDLSNLSSLADEALSVFISQKSQNK